MKKIFTLLLVASASLFTTVGVQAQIYYDFTTATPTSNGSSNITAGPITQGNNNGTTPLLTTTSASAGYPGASGGNNAGAAANTGGFNPVTSTYFEVTLTPTAGNSVVLTGISFGSRSTSTGPQAANVRTSVDGYATDQATFVLQANSIWTFYSSSLAVTGVTGSPVTLRIYGYNGAGSPGPGTANWRIDDLTINPTALPLKLTSFNASIVNNAAALGWTSESESNVKGFSIEKSLNGTNFSEIGFVGATNRSSQSNYTFTDNNLKAGVSYYRLKMQDLDGASKMSQVVVINNKSSIKAEVFPNPAFSNLTVSHNKAFKGALINILSIEGKLVKSYPVAEGAVQTGLSVNELVKGNYLLIFKNNGKTSSTQFSKQ
ncbi:MAG: hypothetical protein JWQ96_1206 [Segetibacter sp.]|nr:hypothetical protein [Segetibacter sp.]